MVLVYVNHVNARIEYIFQFILHEIAGLEYGLITDEALFLDYIGPKFTYGVNFLDAEIHIESFGLLDEQGVREIDIPMVEFEGVNCPFAITNKATFPFDLFSAAFYLVTRYEEYLDFSSDKHGRFQAVKSMAFREEFLEKAVVNRWAISFREKIVRAFPEVKYKQASVQSLCTVDIDQAYAYKGKGIIRLFAALAIDILKLNFTRCIERLQVLLFNEQDPFDTVPYIISYVKNIQSNAVFFLHLGDYGKYDKSLKWNHKLTKKLVGNLLQNKIEMGLHPSYASDKENQLKLECKRFEELTNGSLMRSRQHFLKMTFPKTYQNLIQQNIVEDYSMGYADKVGFRASTATPFQFYNLKNETITALKVYPFVAMDVTLKNYMKLSVDSATLKMNELMQEINTVGGFYSTIWHNESLSDLDEWKGWRVLFELTAKLK